MTALIIGQHEKDKLDKVRKYAEEHPMSEEDLKQIMAGLAPPPGSRIGYWCELPVGVKVVYSIDHFTDGKARHLSISIAKRDRYPSIAIVEQLMQLLGFQKKATEADSVYMENGPHAINIIEYL